MGIDKRDIRLVVHVGLPQSVGAYVNYRYYVWKGLCCMLVDFLFYGVAVFHF